MAQLALPVLSCDQISLNYLRGSKQRSVYCPLAVQQQKQNSVYNYYSPLTKNGYRPSGFHRSKKKRMNLNKDRLHIFEQNQLKISRDRNFLARELIRLKLYCVYLYKITKQMKIIVFRNYLLQIRLKIREK
jgi:hypothetical protein